MSRKADLKFIQEILNNSLGHAIIRIFKRKKFIIKIYLAFVSILLISLAAFLTIQSIINYFNYQVITTSRTISETPTTFPKITICNLNMFTSKFASDLVEQVNQMISQNFSFFDPSQIKYISNEKISKLFQVIDIGATALIFTKNNAEDYKKLAHNFEEIFISCQFNFQKCDASDFVWSFDPYYGNCYSFNTGFNSTGHQVALKESSVSGWLFGLNLELYVNFNENLTLFNGASGVIVQIGNSSYSNYQYLDGNRVAPGFRTDIAISREFNFILPQPYSNCLVDSTFRTYDSTFFNLILNSSYQYSQKLCLEQCFQQESLRYCNCTVSIFVSLFENGRNCNDPESLNCSMNTFYNIYLSNDFIRQQCLPLCPLECNSTIYKTSLSYDIIYGHKYINHIIQHPNILDDFNNKSIDANKASQSVSFLNIYYDSLSYKLSNESPQMDIVSLLASIGGNLSLFLGVSVFSLSEVIEILIEICLLLREKIRSKKVVNFSNVKGKGKKQFVTKSIHSI